MQNPRYANAAGGILLEQAAGHDLYVDSGDLYTRAVAGEFGPVASWPGPSLESIKSDKLAAIERARDSACFASVAVNGHTWQADPRSQELLSNAVRRGRAGKPLPPTWRDADNADMAISSLADLEAIEDAIAAATHAAYERSWALKAQLAAATTPEEMEAVQW